jgi:hypothetical protein
MGNKVSSELIKKAGDIVTSTAIKKISGESSFGSRKRSRRKSQRKPKRKSQRKPRRRSRRISIKNSRKKQ